MKKFEVVREHLRPGDKILGFCGEFEARLIAGVTPDVAFRTIGEIYETTVFLLLLLLPLPKRFKIIPQ